MHISNEMDLLNVRCDSLGGISAAVIDLPIVQVFDVSAFVDAETGLSTRPAT